MLTEISLHKSVPLNQNNEADFSPLFFTYLFLPRLYFLHSNPLSYVAGSVCQHLLYKGAQTLTGYDIYYFLSHIISALHKVLINAFGDEAFSPLRKA